ncbi:hypothetical protein TNCV_1011861 [Trichonephila clavipes]|uniref:Uncharacterized protein n=1 Tax=Trichonephila clavipes TaxID=2585209 RepID=A0A8X6VX67_TRICX|nr:hypothetical protein TNCV_1011861 [Trichonephila clavipes]
MSPVCWCHIEAHKIHRDKELDEHHTGDSTIWLSSTPILRENTLDLARMFTTYHQPYERTWGFNGYLMTKPELSVLSPNYRTAPMGGHLRSRQI